MPINYIESMRNNPNARSAFESLKKKAIEENAPWRGFYGYKPGSGILPEAERRSRDEALAKMTETADVTAGAVNPASEYYFGPGGMSEWKRGQLATRTGATTGAYNNAIAQNRLRARTAGFGYEQPAEQAGETNIEMARAAELARIPGDVEAEAIPIAFQGMQTRLASGGQQAGAYGQAASEYSPEQFAGIAADIEEAKKARKSGLWSGLFKVGSAIAAPFTGGSSLAGLGAF